MLQQDQMPKGNSLRNVCIERKEMCPASLMNSSTVESVVAAPGGLTQGSLPSCQDHVYTEKSSAGQPGCSQPQLHGSSAGERLSCHQLRNQEHLVEHNNPSSKAAEKCEDHGSSSAKLLPSSMPSSIPMRKPVDIMMHKDRINLLRQMSQVFNEEQHVAVADASSASEDEREEKDATKENVITRKKGSNICSEKPIVPVLDKMSDNANLRTTCEGKKKSASNGALKPLVSNSSEVRSINSEELAVSGKSFSVDETAIKNKTDNENCNNSRVEELKVKEASQPEESYVKTNASSKLVNLEIKQGKVYHVSSYSKRVQEKISVKSFVGKRGEHVDIIDGFSFISFEDKTALLSFELSTSGSRKPKCGKKIKDSEQSNSDHFSETRNKGGESIPTAGEVEVADAAASRASHVSLQTREGSTDENDVISKPSNLSSVEFSAFSSSRLDEFLCKNSTLNISYDVPECRKTVEGVSKVWDEDGQDTSVGLKLRSSSVQTTAPGNKILNQKLDNVNGVSAGTVSKTLPSVSVQPVKATAAANGFLSRIPLSEPRPMSPAPSNASPIATSSSESNVKSSESFSTESSPTSLPCKLPKVVSKTSSKSDRKFLRPKSSEVFVCRGGKLVPLTSIIKRGSPPKPPEKKKTSDLIYVYHDGEFLTMGGSLCNVDPRYSRSLTSQVMLPINLINKPCQKRKTLTHSNFRAVLIDKRMADFALSALRKPISTHKDYHKNSSFVRNGPLNCRRQGAVTKVKPRTTKSSILDIITQKLAIDVVDGASRDANVGSELERRDSKLVQKNLHRFPSLSREMQRLDKKYIPSTSVDAAEPGREGGQQQQQLSLTRGPAPEDRPMRGCLQPGVKVKRCEVKVPWYRLPPSLKVWCLVHHCYDCSCGLAAPPPDPHVSLEQPQQEGQVKKVVGLHQENPFGDHRFKKALGNDFSSNSEFKDKLEDDTSADRTVLKVKPELLSPDAAFTALLNSRTKNRDDKEKESELRVNNSVETLKSNNFVRKNALVGSHGIFSQKMSSLKMHRNTMDKIENSPIDNKTPLGFSTLDRKVTEHGSQSKASSEVLGSHQRPPHSGRKRENSLCSQEELSSSRCRKFKAFVPTREREIPNMKSMTEGSSYSRAGSSEVLNGDAKTLEKLSLLGSSFSRKNFTSPLSMKTVDAHASDGFERSIGESSSAQCGKALDTASGAGCGAENTCDQQSVLPECVILELCVGQREGSAGRPSGPTIHNIIKHWSHDTNHSARTCGYSREGKSYRAVLNPQKQGFDYMPPIAPCNSNATIKSVLSAFLKRGYIRDVQNEDKSLKYEPEEANAVYCRNRNLPVAERKKIATPAAQMFFPREGCESPVRPSSVSSCKSVKTPVSGPGILLSSSPSKSSVCADIASDKNPVSSCITRPVASPGINNAITTTNSSSSYTNTSGYGSKSSNSCSSLSNQGSWGEMKLKMAWKRGHQPGEGVAVTSCVSLPEMVQAEERRGELELDLTPAPPGTAMLVTEARFRKLINMNIIGVIGLNKQSRCIIAPVESSEMLAKMRLIQTQISNRLLDVGPNMRDIFFPPHQPTGTVVKPRFIMIRCDKSGSWEIAGLVQKKSSDHQADNVHFTTSDIFDTSPTKKTYGCDQLPLKSETPSTVGSLKKTFSSAASLGVSSSPSSASVSFSETILGEISDTSSALQCDLRSSDATCSQKPLPSFDDETLHLSSETSVTNCRTEPLPSISSELLTPTKSLPLYTVQTHSKDKPIISFNLIPFSDQTTSSKCDLLSLPLLPSMSTQAHRSSTFSKISSNLVQNRDSSCAVKTDVLSKSSSICKTTNVTSSSISSSCPISTPCEPAPNSGLSPMKMNVVYKVPLTLTNILRPSSTQASFSGSSCSNSVNVMSALETDVRPINCQHKDDAVSSQSSPSKDSLVTCTATCQPSLSSHVPSVKSQQHFPLKDTEEIPRKSDHSKISSSSNEIPGEVCTDGAQVLSSAKNLLVEEQIDAVGCRKVKGCEKPPFALTFTESRPSELSSLSMTSLSSKNTTTSLASASVENKTTVNEFTKPTITKSLKWAAIDLSINFKSIKLGWLKGTIQKSILAQIRSTSLESCGVVTFTVRGSEEETILYGRSKVMRKPNILLLILGSSISALDVASGLPIIDLFKNNMMAYVFRGDEGERTFYRYVAPNFLTPIESKKEALSPTKQRRLPLELFRESSVSHCLLKRSIINNDISNEPSSIKSSFSCVLTDTGSYQADPLVSKPNRNEKLVDGEGILSKEEHSLKVDTRLKETQLAVGADAGGESITVSSEAADSGVPQSAVLSCHEITHCAPLVELSCSAQPAVQWPLPPDDKCEARKEPALAGAAPDGCGDTVPAALPASRNAACGGPRHLPHPTASPVAPVRGGGQLGSSQSGSPSHETQSSSASEHELSICLSEDSVQIFPAEDESAGDEVASLTVSSTLCEKDQTITKELLGERMKSSMRKNSLIRIRKSKVKARRGSKLLQRYSNGSPGKDIGSRMWRAESAGARVGGPSSLARMRAAVARGSHKNGKAVTLKRSSSSNAVGSVSHSSAIVGERPPLEVTEGAASDGYGSSSGSSRASRRAGHGRGKDSSHNEMERLRRKEIGELFVELQAVLQQEKGEDLPDCKKEVWPKRMTLKMAISLLEAKREQQWMLARKEDELVQQLNANKRHLRSLLEHSQASAKDREAAEELLKLVAPPSRVKELDQLEQWAVPATKRCRPDTSDEEYVLDVEGSDSNTSEDLCSTLSTPATSPPYAAVPRALSAHRPGQKLSKSSPLGDSAHMRRLFVQENGKRKKLMSSEQCKSGRGQGRMRLLAYEGAQSRDSSSDAADDVGAAGIDSGSESSSASDASTEAPPSLSFSTLSFSNLPSQLLPTSMCSEPLLSSPSKPSSPDRDLL